MSSTSAAFEASSRSSTYSTKPLPPELTEGKPYLPFIGHSLEFYRRPTDLLMRGRKKYGDLFTFTLAGQKIALFTGPEANEAFFRAGSDQLSPREVYQFMVPVFGKGIVYDSPEEIMDEQLSFLFPALTQERLRTYSKYLAEEAENFFASWGESGETDLYMACNALTTYNAARAFCGKEFRSRVTSEFAKLYKDLEGGINILAYFSPNLPLPAFRRRDKARRRVVEIITQIISERRTLGVTGEDFLQTLMDARYKDGHALSAEEITGLLLAVIFAGQHTSAVMATWSAIELLRNPGYKTRVVAEQEQLIGQRTDVTFEDLKGMTTLERAIKETERLHPPLIMLMRKVKRDLDYKGYRVPSGWMGMVSPHVSHRLPEVFTNPDVYDPDRFAPGREEDKKANYTLIGFGGGKHRCIGLHFGYMQVKSVVGTMLRYFDIELTNREPLPDYSSFVVGPQLPCKIRYRRKKR